MVNHGKLKSLLLLNIVKRLDKKKKMLNYIVSGDIMPHESPEITISV